MTRLWRAGMVLLCSAGLMLITLPPTLGEETPKADFKATWTGKWKDGRVMTKEDLAKILQSHTLWEDSAGKEGQKAVLSHTDLSGVWLNHANLSRARLDSVNLSRAVLLAANLSGATLAGANLSGPCSGADLRDFSMST